MRRSVSYIQIIARIASPLIASIVTFLSLLPSSALSKPLTIFPFSDKILHLIAYIAVSFTVSIALIKVEDNLKLKDYLVCNLRRIIISLFVVFAMGLCIELVQPWFSRQRELLDLLFNGIGAVIGEFIAVFIFFFIQRRANVETNRL